RLDCGAYGINEEGCYSRGCCWGESTQSGVPWCYHSVRKSTSEQSKHNCNSFSQATMKPGCLMNNEERAECGWYGIRKHQCMAKGCCWQPNSNPSAPWCF
ncbi:hypothetical protein CAPTEDRAFT_87401, partial [Capitella teleta]